MLIQFKRRFSMAHRLRFDRNSKCMTPHGHNEFVTVDLKPRAEARGVDWGASNYAASFADMKRHWHGFVDDALDHAFQLGHDDPMIGYFQMHEPELLPRLLIIQGDPTTEAVATALYMKLNAILAVHLPAFECVRFEIEETPTNSVILTSGDIAACPIRLGEWCHRPDLSLNDLVPADA
ncbi:MULTISPECIES: 6-carboxytetrahydropterin synthase [Asticcacaulis]|uniref:6-carboxytetrahydropterin synthase n=1 Tax=Asticcacaulis TaxID=76890 RepID=UPI001AE17C85|nr:MULTISPECIES: 6-carboxytetrahydropterin synthase [Asticcacaulis]MBP2157726.1 6-pyruvoyltetrahydropterin/6-carboxytetrahydropterin synthase [Asticcacaulis solisilvae]MDR6798771.1 6-pyruvoyltetrahydropterin/6-carboxytetrahydropterin synthase [Asticcacaulis sp. BE141]